MSDESLPPTEVTAALIIKLMARCDALELALLAVGSKAGMESDKVEKLLQYLNELTHQKRLEQVETSHPDIAAKLDWRTEYPDLLD